MTTNIESREQRRCDNADAGRSPEHPRASTTDDCECFFSVLRDNIGKNFTLKEVKYNFRKVCIEFGKRIDPDLPFFYHTSYHTRFAEGELPEFDKAPPKAKRVQRVPLKESKPLHLYLDKLPSLLEVLSLLDHNFITSHLTFLLLQVLQFIWEHSYAHQ